LLQESYNNIGCDDEEEEDEVDSDDNIELRIEMKKCVSCV
jgi:hypothetical protein